MNSILQCLSHTVKLRDYALLHKYRQELNKKSRLRGKLFIGKLMVLLDGGVVEMIMFLSVIFLL